MRQDVPTDTYRIQLAHRLQHRHIRRSHWKVYQDQIFGLSKQVLAQSALNVK